MTDISVNEADAEVQVDVAVRFGNLSSDVLVTMTLVAGSATGTYVVSNVLKIPLKIKVF